MYSDSLNLIEEFVDDSSTSQSDGVTIERKASRVQGLTGFRSSDTNEIAPRCGALMEMEKKLVMTRRGSIGISMEDIIELTGESQGYASAAGYGHGPTKSKAWRRSSLDLIISSDKQIPDAEDLDTSFHYSKSMSMSAARSCFVGILLDREPCRSLKRSPSAAAGCGTGAPDFPPQFDCLAEHLATVSTDPAQRAWHALSRPAPSFGSK